MAASRVTDVRLRSHRLAAVLAEIEPLWVGGLMLLVLLSASFVFGSLIGLTGEPFELALYVTFGTLFPLGVLLLATNGRGRSASPHAYPIRVGLAILLLLSVVPFFVARHEFRLVIVAAIQLGLTLPVLMRGRAPSAWVVVPWRVVLGRGLPLLVALVLCWMAAARFLYWEPLGRWVIQDPASVLVFVLSLALVTRTVMCSHRDVPPSDGRWSRWAGNALDLVALIVISVASIRMSWLFDYIAVYHWGQFLGPAEMVRSGAWLLWDVPSPYGFLSILVLTALPFATVWHSLYVLQACALFLTTGFIYWLFRALHRPVVHRLVALLLAVAAVHLMVGWLPDLTGPQRFPNVGPYRFVWCYVLLAILLWGRRADRGAGAPRSVLWAGCVVWLIGVLWSAESAWFCSATWLPAYVLLVARRARLRRAAQGSMAAAIGEAAWGLLRPLLMLLGAGGAILTWYWFGLGHGPDWTGYVEWSGAYGGGGGYAAMAIDPGGPVWTLLLVLAALATAVAFLIRERGLTSPAVGVMVGGWFAFWAISVYFVGRSHPVNATNLSPMLVIAIGLSLLIMAESSPGRRWQPWVRASFVPVLTVMLIATYGNRPALTRNLASPEIDPPSILVNRLPVMDRALLSLVEAAGVQRGDPIVIFDGSRQTLAPAWPADPEAGQGIVLVSRPWVPAHPFAASEALPETRNAVYFTRFAERAQLSGWLIERRDAEFHTPSWFFAYVAETHVATRSFENADWQVTWFEYQPKGR
jgi:hypothetical protein